MARIELMLSVCFAAAVLSGCVSTQPGRTMAVVPIEKDRPAVAEEEPMAPRPTTKSFRIAVSESGTVALDGRDVAPENLLSGLEEAGAKKDDHVIVQVARGMDYKDIVSLLDRLKTDGYMRLHLVTTAAE